MTKVMKSEIEAAVKTLAQAIIYGVEAEPVDPPEPTDPDAEPEPEPAPAPTPTPVPAQPSPYGAIIEPEEPVITAPQMPGWGPVQRKDGQSIIQHDAWRTDRYAAWKADDVRLELVNVSDILLERMGPYIDMRGADSIRMSRVKSVEGKYTSQGFGLLRATDTIGSFYGEHLIFEAEGKSVNVNNAWAAICLFGKDVDDVCTDWSVQYFRFKNCLMADGEYYRNCDGIAIERGHDSGLIENGVIDTCSDAGIDCKGYNVRINQMDIASCRQSLKLWDGSDRHGRIISRTPRYAHILAASDNEQVADAPIIIDRLECPDAPDKPVVAFEGGKTVIIKTLIAPEEQKLYTADSKARAADKPAELWINGSQVL